MDSPYVCMICEQKVAHGGALHTHLKSHKTTLKEYFPKYYPKYDLYTNELIEFKSTDQYRNAKFNDRKNLKLFIKNGEESKVKQFCLDYLKERIAAKGLTTAPTQVELRSLNGPSILTYNKFFGDYYELCRGLGLGIKHKTVAEFPKEDFMDFQLLMDTREQTPLRFPKVPTVQKLDFGDYCLMSPIIQYEVFFERKSLQDFIQTLTKGLSRFKNELIRAKEANKHLIIVVEEQIGTCLGFNFIPYVRRFTRVQPEFVFHAVREICQEFHNVQFLFVKGREEAIEKMIKVYRTFGKYTELDLQYCYDAKLF